MKRYYKISEVADQLNVTQNSLRNYQIIFKLKIGRNRSNHRVFNEISLSKMKYIVYLLNEEGYTVKGAVKKYNLIKKDFKNDSRRFKNLAIEIAK